jgi:hypothetical protein
VKSEDAEGNYETKHHPDCPRQTCQLPGPKIKEVIGILENGSFPLLTRLGNDT